VASNKLRLHLETFDGRPDKGHRSTVMLIDSFHYNENALAAEFNLIAVSKNDKLKVKWAKGTQYEVEVFDGDNKVFGASINAMGDSWKAA
jgi:hypothetical protein